jgi:hypothetical protein
MPAKLEIGEHLRATSELEQYIESRSPGSLTGAASPGPAANERSARVEELERQLATVYRSKSWKLTAPLRSMARRGRRVLGAVRRRA